MKTPTLICLCALLAHSAGAPSEIEPTTTAPVTSQKCAPGSSEFDGCNTCVCLKDGSGMSCTKKICEPTPTPGEAAGELCNPGEYIGTRGCVPCECVMDGSEEICRIKSCDDVTNAVEGATKTGEGHGKMGGGDTKTGGGAPKTGEGHGKMGGGGTKMGGGAPKTGEGHGKVGGGDTKTSEGATKASEGATKTGDGATKTGEGRICEPGHTENDGCNTCVCNSEGTGKECTKQICT